MEEVFAGYDEGDRITVLDLGPGNADTIRYLSQFRARVYFADLLDHPHLSQLPEDCDDQQIAAWFEEQLAMPQDALLDVCLLWDYLHYFNLHTLEILSSVLQRQLAKGARGYGFGTLQGKPPGDTNEYGIIDSKTLTTHPVSQAHHYFAHSQQRLSEHFPALHIVRGTLLREGRLELLMQGV